MMKLWLPLFAAVFASSLWAASPADATGTWKVVYQGDPRTGPKTVGSMILDLHIDGNKVTGMAKIGTWPGDAPIADGIVEGGRITFTATGHMDSTTGIPTCKFVVTFHEDEMLVTLSAIENGGGPLPQGYEFKYRGTRKKD